MDIVCFVMYLILHLSDLSDIVLVILYSCFQCIVDFTDLPVYQKLLLLITCDFLAEIWIHF